MNELIERLQKATGPDRELDCAIAEFAGTYSAPDRGDPDGTWPPYTASMDAALTLVPKDNWWEVNQRCSPTSPMRNFGIAGGIFSARTHSNYGEAGHAGYHDAPAIALSIAALKARAAMIGEKRGEK